MIKNKWGYLKPVMWCYKALGTTWTRTHLYGSIIAQNLTEAVCRDLIAAAMLKCEARGLPVCMSIHDELVCETDTDKSKELEAILDEKPSWGLDFPLGAECFASAYYKK
jgi:DNA polymerase